MRHPEPARARVLAPILAAALAAAGLVSCLPPPETPLPARGSDDPELLYAAHRESGRYFNPWGPFEKRPTDVARFLFGRNPWPEGGTPAVPRMANDGASLGREIGGAELTWVGHATVAIHDRGDVVLTDPHFGPRALWPRREVPPGIPLESVPADAMAVISHSHYDHLDAWTVERLPDTVSWFVPPGLGDWFRRRGRERVVELDWWQSARRGRWTVTCLPSQHWSRRIEHRTNRTLWCSWLLDSGERRYYFAGDTGYFHGFAEYRRRFAPIDVALLPVGAYEPRWFMAPQHLNPEEAYRAFEDLGARYMVPIHWGTFDLTYEPVDEGARAFRRVVEASGAAPERSPVLAVGERWRLPPREGPAAAVGAEAEPGSTAPRAAGPPDL